MKYDAILETVLPVNISDCVGRTFAGYIHEDGATHGNHPFENGTEIQTTCVTQVIVERSGIFFLTRNTVYKVRPYIPVKTQVVDPHTNVVH